MGSREEILTYNTHTASQSADTDRRLSA